MIKFPLFGAKLDNDSTEDEAAHGHSALMAIPVALGAAALVFGASACDPGGGHTDHVVVHHVDSGHRATTRHVVVPHVNHGSRPTRARRAR